MRVLYSSRKRKPEVEFALGCEYRSFEELLAEADFVSLHCALTPDTRHVINRDALARMKRTAVLVNTGRGGLVDQAALIDAVVNGRIAGAGLDVTDPEPLPAGHPLWSQPGVLIAPHVGGASSAMAPRIARLVRAQIERMVAGEAPLNVVIDA